MAASIPPDDFAPDTTTSGALAAGDTLTGKMDWDDHDWFRLDLVAGATYRFKLDGLGLYGYNGGQVFPTLALHGADGTMLAETVTESRYHWAYVQYTSIAGGTYYLDVSASMSAGNYTVTMERMEPDAVPSQPAGAPLLSMGTRVEGVFEYAGDSDWYRFHADPGQHLKFSTPLGTAADAAFASGFAVYDDSGKLLNANFPFEPMASGDYYLAVQSDAKSSYTLLMTSLEDDYAANAGTTGKLVPGGAAASGKHQYAWDRDAFRMAVEAGKIYTVKIAGIAGDLRYVRGSVTDGAGAYAASNGVTGDKEYTFSFKAAKDGDYFISVNSTASTQATAEVSYTVQSDGGVADDHGDDAAHGTAVLPEQAVQGALQGWGDTDVFRVELQAGVTYEMEAASAGKAALLLMDASGNQVAGGDYFQALSKIVLTPEVSGAYFARVSGVSLAYTFKTSAAADDYAANAGTAGSLAVGGSAWGTLESNADVDWFAVTLYAGVTYWFGSASTDSTDFMHYRGPDIVLADAQGKTLAAQPQGLYSSVTPVMQYVPETSGTYYVSTGRNASDRVAHYTVTAKVGEQDDYGSVRSGAVALAENTQLKGRLALPQDTDMFRFTAAAGTAYVVELTDSRGMKAGHGFSATVESDLPGVLRDAGSYNKVQLFEPQASGDYYITVKGNGEVSGNYGLRLLAVPGDTVMPDKGTSAVLQAGQPVHAALESRYDADWFKVALQPDHTYAFELQGALSGNGTLDALKPGLKLVENYTNVYTVAESYAYSPYSEPVLTYKPARGSDYYVAVDGGGNAEGSYVLKVTDLTNDRKGPALVSVSHGADAAVDLSDTITLAFDERIKVNGDGVALKAGDVSVYLKRVVDTSGAPLAIDNRLVIDPSSRLEFGTTYTVELKPGSVTDMAGNPYTGQMSFNFTTVPLRNTGTAGNDYLKGSGNPPLLEGGAGIDTAIFDNMAAYYSIAAIGNGKFTVTPRYASMGGATTVDGVERLELRYEHVALDVEGTAGQAYRLYQAAFNRTPDASGVGYWISQMDKGMPLLDVARNFVASAEFQKLYGASPSDSAFVDLLYNNVLHRAPEAKGAEYWNGVLHDGMAREQVLAYFSEGAENHDAVAKLIANGFSYTPYG